LQTDGIANGTGTPGRWPSLAQEHGHATLTARVRQLSARAAKSSHQKIMCGSGNSNGGSKIENRSMTPFLAEQIRF